MKCNQSQDQTFSVSYLILFFFFVSITRKQSKHFVMDPMYIYTDLCFLDHTRSPLSETHYESVSVIFIEKKNFIIVVNLKCSLITNIYKNKQTIEIKKVWRWTQLQLWILGGNIQIWTDLQQIGITLLPILGRNPRHILVEYIHLFLWLKAFISVLSPYNQFNH